MELRNLGRSGLRVSAVGLGCNNFGRALDLAGSRPVIHKALDLGVTFFDCADVYGGRGGSETILAEVLGARRKDIVLATKFGRPMDDAGQLQVGSRRYIFMAVEASLRRLKTDWIDLYFYHRYDPLTPIEETVRALDDLVRQGKVRYVGCSQSPPWVVVDALWHARMERLNGFICCEDEYNVLTRRIERELVPAMTTHGLGLLPYYPLASGMLTGKYKRGEPYPPGSRFDTLKERAGQFVNDATWPRLERLTRFAEQRGHKLVDLAMSWLARRPLVASVIAGATKAEQVEQNVKAAGWALSPEEMVEIDALCA